MKLSENVQVETNEVKATNSRVARMARYSTAAAGVAAVSTLDVDAAMIKVIVTDPSAQNVRVDTRP
jgi:NADPH-dependent ferric siderophore reductase